MNKIQAVRGMQDLYGEKLHQWKAIEQKIEKVLESFLFEEIRTPVLESKEVFSQTVGDDTDIVEKQMYEVLSPSNAGEEKDKMVMRPEGTAAFIRCVIEHGLHREGHPGRYYYNIPMFRYERPQKGRLRQFHQIGAELIQDASPEADSEIILLLDQVFKSIGIAQYEIALNSVGCSKPECRPQYKKELITYFKKHIEELCGSCQQKLERAPIRILDCKSESCKKVAEHAPLITDHLCEECDSHFKAVQKNLKTLNVAFKLDPKIVRGLDYYTKTAFEFTTSLLGAQNALGGGGRYDGLSERFGEKPFPAIGWALGFERLMLVLETIQALPKDKLQAQVYFAALDKQAFEVLYPLSLELKTQGIKVAMDYKQDKKLGWFLKQADRSEATFAVILGEEEFKKKEVLLKNMKDSSQENLSLATLKNELIRRLST